MEHPCRCPICEENHIFDDMKEGYACTTLICCNCSSTHYGFIWCDVCWQAEYEERGDGEE